MIVETLAVIGAMTVIAFILLVFLIMKDLRDDYKFRRKD